MQPEVTGRRQLPPNPAAVTVRLREAVAAAVTAAVALHLPGVIPRVVRAVPEAAGHLRLHPHHQAEEDNQHDSHKI